MLKRIGSGDPCWCGSRKPYGQCHQEFDRKVSRARFMGHEMPSHKIIKTPEQIQGIRESGKLNVAVLDYVAERIRAGITTAEIDQWVYDYTTKHGGIPAPLGYEGFPKSVCTSIDAQVCHGIPSEDVVLKRAISSTWMCHHPPRLLFRFLPYVYDRGCGTGKGEAGARRQGSGGKGTPGVKPWGYLGDMGQPSMTM